MIEPMAANKGGIMLAFCVLSTDDEESRHFLESLYVRFQRQMILTAYGVVKNYEDAEDCVQDVFLRLAKKCPPRLRSLSSETDLRNYLLKATKNAAISHLRGRRHDQLSLEEVGGAGEDRSPELSDEDFLERICTHSEFEECLKAIQNLPPLYRDVLYQHFVLELPISDVAELLGRKASTIKQQIRRGKRLLLQQLHICDE